MSYYDDEQQLSVNETTQRARRRRKDTLDEMSAAELAYDSSVAACGAGRQQERELGGEAFGGGGLKRRNTVSRKGGSGSSGGDAAAGGAERSAKGPASSPGTLRTDKVSANTRQDRTSTASKGGDQHNEEAAFTSSLLEKSSKESNNTEDEDEEEEEKPDEKNVTFCMWGHENCKTRSHYRYNWQWDYVQKYVDQHNKKMLSGYLPRDSESGRTSAPAVAAEEKNEGGKAAAGNSNKPSKEGIKVRLQMLQNRLSQGKTSDSVKQKMFERDLELEMLRRKKTYQF